MNVGSVGASTIGGGARQARSADAGEDITALAKRFVALYDHDKNGAVDLSNAKELERIDQRNDGGSGHYAVMSGSRLMRAADAAGNKDGVVTTSDIEALGKRYDTGNWFAWHHVNDGALDGVEMLRAMGEVGEEFKSFVGASGRSDGGATVLVAGQEGGFFATGGRDGGIILGGNPQGGAVAVGNAQAGAAAVGNQNSGSGSWWDRLTSGNWKW